MRLIDADALKEELSYKSPATEFDTDSVILGVIDEQPTASPWHRVEEPPKKTGKYAACWIYQEKIYWDWLIFIDGNWALQAGLPLPDSGLPLPDYWMPIEPPKEEA